MDELPELPKKEREEAEELSTVRVHVVYEAVRLEGEDELSRPSSSLFWSAVAAGLSMGFSLITEGLISFYLPDAAWRPLVAKLGYCMGFVFVVLGRQQLFTENTLTVVLPLLAAQQQRRRQLLTNVLRVWGVVLIGNILGSLVISTVLAGTGAFSAELKHAFAEVGLQGLGLPPGTLVLKGIFAGWLIALMVWLLPAAETARVGIIILVTYLVALGGFPHVVAGSIDVLFLVARGDLGLGDYFFRFFVPTLIGNVIGGTALVAALNTAQVKVGRGVA